MSFQWTLIAGYLYFEIAIVIIMIMPLFSPRRWHQLFKSRLFALFQEHAAIYFYVLLGVLCLFLMDAVREMRKYSHSTDTVGVHLASEMKGNVKLFRAQRNFYITGFSIFLAFVIRRLVTMLIIQDELSLKAEKIIKEAEATVKHAKTTILANTLQTSEIQNIDELKKQVVAAEILLKEEKDKVNKLEEDIAKWKVKFEETMVATKARGDE